MSAGIKNMDNVYEDMTITIEGMKCFYCFTIVAGILKEFIGIKEVRVGLTKGQAIVTYNREKTDLGRLVDELKKAGYEVKLNV